MNKEHVLFHLREAKEELDSLIRDVTSEPDFEFGEYVVGMSHLYHHVNTAWNGRDASPQDAEECTQSNFDSWRQMPNSEELLLVSEDET